MKTQVTKRKLTLKNKKAASAPDTAAEGAGAEEGTAPAAAKAPGKTGVNAAYHKPAAIMAILASLIVLGLIAVQVMEWVYYQSPPSAWPIKAPAATR